MKFFDFKKKKAQKLHEQAQDISNENEERAIELYKEAIKLDSNKSESYYNLGLIYKYQNKWEESFKYNKVANELNPEDEAARWNLGIAATALRNWEISRFAWSQNGISLDDKVGSINMNFGDTPIRLNPNSEAEVVWSIRLCPARARINNVPFIESGFNFGDIVLNDGAAEGFRTIGERKYPVFNVLELFEASKYKTELVTVEISNDKDLEVLEELFEKSQHEFEDWTSNYRLLCRQCSYGEPHEEHDKELEKEWQSKRKLGVAVYNNLDTDYIFKEWQSLRQAKVIEV